MKIATVASSIVFLSCIFILSGCEDIYVPNFFGPDEVPDEVKARPRHFNVAPPSVDEPDWPRLGDVPAKPKDFSTKNTYERTIDELEAHRAETEEARSRATADDDVAAQYDQEFPEEGIPQISGGYE